MKNHDYFFIEKIDFKETIYNKEAKEIIQTKYMDLPIILKEKLIIVEQDFSLI